jgi:hypothetical protein
MLAQSAYATEVQNKMQWVLRRTNTMLTKANSMIVDREFNGLYKQHEIIIPGKDGAWANFDQYYSSNTVIDLRGKTLTQYTMEDAAVNLDANFAGISDFFAPPAVIAGLTKDYFDDQRLLIGQAQNGEIGMPARVINTMFGPVHLNSDKMMGVIRDARVTSQGATSPQAPSAPVADATAPTALVADNLAKFTAGEAGTVFYAVAAINMYGESNLTVLGSTKVAITAGSRVDLKFTPGVGSANPATGYVIYRSVKTASTSASGLTFYPLFKVSPADLSTGFNGATGGIIGDRGYFMANVEQAFVTEMDVRILSWKSLAPLSKVELARTGLTSPFAVFHFGTPFVKAPKKIVRMINVGVDYQRPA